MSLDTSRVPRGKELIDLYRQQFGERCVLAFSRGKDSIATYLAIRDHLDVIPVHYTDIPGLTFIEESLDYYERALFKRHIIRMPHPALFRKLNASVFITLAQAEVVAAANLQEPSYADIHNMVCRQEGASTDILGAVGVRAADSPLRRTSVVKHGVIRPRTKAFWPIWDWSKGQTLAAIRDANISLPMDYVWWGRSFDGLDARFLVIMKREAPDDYKKVLEWFPLVEAEVMRYEMHTKGSSHAQANGRQADAQRGRVEQDERPWSADRD